MLIISFTLHTVDASSRYFRITKENRLGISDQYLQFLLRSKLKRNALLLNYTVNNTKATITIHHLQNSFTSNVDTLWSWFVWDKFDVSWIQFQSQSFGAVVSTKTECNIPSAAGIFKLIGYKILNKDPLKISIEKFMEYSVSNQNGRWNKTSVIYPSVDDRSVDESAEHKQQTQSFIFDC